MDAVLLADRPDLIAPLAAAYEAEWPEWYGRGGPGDAEADLNERARRSGLPLGIVVVEQGEPVAALAITGPTIPGYEQLSPWLGGGWTHPDRRRQGIGALMIRAAVEQAREMGFKRLYVATSTAVSLMEREGWRLLEVAEHEGQPLSVFALDLGRHDFGPPR